MANSTVRYIALMRQLASFTRMGWGSLLRSLDSYLFVHQMRHIPKELVEVDGGAQDRLHGLVSRGYHGRVVGGQELHLLLAPTVKKN